MNHVDSISRLSVIAAVVTLIASVVGSLLFRGSGSLAVQSVFVASAVCLAAFGVGNIVLARVCAGRPEDSPPLVVAASVARLGVALVIGALVTSFWTPAWTVFCLWAAVLYVLLLAVDTAMAVRMIQDAQPAPSADGAPVGTGPKEGTGS